MTLMPWPGTHYGCRVVELGEDGDYYAVAGHCPPRRAVAAVMHYLRVDCGFTVASDRDYFADVAEATVQHRWIYESDDDEDPWEWTDAHRAGAQPVTLVSL